MKIKIGISIGIFPDDKESELYIKINHSMSIHNDGTKFSFNKRKCHKVDGPSIEYRDGSEGWYFEEKCHRKYGPARKWRNDNDEWWLEDKMITHSLWNMFLMRLRKFS